MRVRVRLGGGGGVAGRDLVRVPSVHLVRAVIRVRVRAMEAAGRDEMSALGGSRDGQEVVVRFAASSAPRRDQSSKYLLTSALLGVGAGEGGAGTRNDTTHDRSPGSSIRDSVYHVVSENVDIWTIIIVGAALCALRQELRTPFIVGQIGIN